MPNGGCGCCGRSNYSVCCYSTKKSCCKTQSCCPPMQYCCPSPCCMPMQYCCYSMNNNRGCCGSHTGGFAYPTTNNMPNGGCGCGHGSNYSVCCYSSPKCCKTQSCCPPMQYCCPSPCCMPM
ncbi:PREDICTED: keratin-associated protein 5-5-like, partial [Phaethon lepturus]|uniref:keratin-associated protein 5-5-like n=1 Tax=Phaethon lepturus TaxID=97097 RepID=UPI000530BBE0